MTTNCTENIFDFGHREIEILIETLKAFLDRGLPDGFDDSSVRPAFNESSGYVFLINENDQVAMLNGENLELFHFLPYSGQEGFLEELLSESSPDELDADDIEYLLDAAEAACFDLNGTWQKFKDER